jgi:hypothetical protein
LKFIEHPMCSSKMKSTHFDALSSLRAKLFPYF